MNHALSSQIAFQAATSRRAIRARPGRRHRPRPRVLDRLRPARAGLPEPPRPVRPRPRGAPGRSSLLRRQQQALGASAATSWESSAGPARRTRCLKRWKPSRKPRYVPPGRLGAGLRRASVERDAASSPRLDARPTRPATSISIFVPADPKWDPYADDPRFQALLARCAFARADQHPPKSPPGRGP